MWMMLPKALKLIDFGSEESRLPHRPYGNDAGADVYMPYGCTLKTGNVKKMPPGVGIEVPFFIKPFT